MYCSFGNRILKWALQMTVNDGPFTDCYAEVGKSCTQMRLNVGLHAVLFGGEPVKKSN